MNICIIYHNHLFQIAFDKAQYVRAKTGKNTIAALNEAMLKILDAILQL